MLLEISAPDGRRLRHHHDSIEEAKAKLTTGYTVTGIVWHADDNGKGGLVSPLGGPTLMTLLLRRTATSCEPG